MKIVINTCYGGFGLSPKALMRIQEIKGEKCYFFTSEFNKKFTPATETEIKNSITLFVFSVDNPNERFIGKHWEDMTDEEKSIDNKMYKSIIVDPQDRSDPIMVQVVEELGSEANGKFAELKVVEIPDDVKWEIEEYDGDEWIAEIHRTWR